LLDEQLVGIEPRLLAGRRGFVYAVAMILALETSSSLCAVCILDPVSGRVLGEVSNDIGRGHAERLMDDISHALNQAGIDYSDLTAAACGIGPGSFTGIRVGVAAARGFGLALKIPVHGVSSLQAIALLAMAQAGGNAILAVQDAGRDELYAQRFDAQAMPHGPPQALTLEMLLSRLPDAPAFACGSGAARLALRGNIVISPEPVTATAAAVGLASLNPLMTMAPKPLYLRAPDAKPQSGYAIPRAGP
jgi:tRNA threonylcarbamoyl adenosine modification protein YeaZ